MGVQLERDGFTVLQEAWYLAQFVDAELSPEGKYGPQVKLKLLVPFKASEDEQEDVSIWVWCSQKFNPKSNLFLYSQAILGRDWEEEENFDSDLLVGRTVNMFVDSYIKDGVTKNKVTKMKRTTAVASLLPESLAAIELAKQGGDDTGEYDTDDIPF